MKEIRGKFWTDYNHCVSDEGDRILNESVKKKVISKFEEWTKECKINEYVRSYMVDHIYPQIQKVIQGAVVVNSKINSDEINAGYEEARYAANAAYEAGRESRF